MLRRVRGPNRGIELNRRVRLEGKRRANIPEGINRVVGPYSEKFPREIGVIVRNYAPMNVNGWAEISEEDKQRVYDRVQQKYDLEWELPHVRRSVEEVCAERYKDYRNRLHKRFKNAESVEAARAKPPTELKNTRTNEWLWLCDHFQSETFLKRSRAGSANRAKLTFGHKLGSTTIVAAKERLDYNRIELYKHTYCKDGEWASPEAEARYIEMLNLTTRSESTDGESPMTADEAAISVLGVKPGYYPGLGRGPKPPPKSSAATETRTIFLEENLATTNEKLASTNEQLASTNEKLASTSDELAETKNELANQRKLVEWLMQRLAPGERPPE